MKWKWRCTGNSTRLPKTEEILKFTKLMICMNFRIMIQAVIKCFGRSIDKRIQGNSNDTCRYYLYSIDKWKMMVNFKLGDKMWKVNWSMWHKRGTKNTIPYTYEWPIFRIFASDIYRWRYFSLFHGYLCLGDCLSIIYSI